MGQHDLDKSRRNEKRHNNGRQDMDVHAEDLVNAPNIGRLAPGRRNLVQTYEVGDEYVDYGGACEGKGDAVGCFLTDRQRDKLVSKLYHFVQTAQTNYKLALVELKIEELLKKEEDLHWLISLALDLAGAHLAVVLGRALKNVQAAGVAKLAELQLNDAAHGQFSNSSWVSRADQLIAQVSPSRIDSVAKAGMTAAGAGAKKRTQVGFDASAQATKVATLSFIEQLRDSCDIAFEAFIDNVTAHTLDAELVVVFEGMKAKYHSVGAYKASLAEKVQRFRLSGVLDIGRKEAMTDNYDGRTLRDTRVVYVQDISGNKTAWYQRQDGASTTGSSAAYARPGDPMFEQLDAKHPDHRTAWSQFGPRGAGAALLDRPVPAEFRDVAIAHSEARWGATITIDDGMVQTLKQQGVNVNEIRMRLRGSPMYASSSSSASSSSPLRSPSIFPPGRTPWDRRDSAAQSPFIWSPASLIEEKD